MTVIPGKPDFAEAASKDWRLRAVYLTQGRTTYMGALLLAILQSKRGRPSFGLSAVIHPDSWLVTTHIDAYGVIHPAARICTLDEYKSFLYDLAVQCEMSDKECEALFAEARKYISSDLRPHKDNQTLESILKAAELRPLLQAKYGQPN